MGYLSAIDDNIMSPIATMLYQEETYYRQYDNLVLQCDKGEEYHRQTNVGPILIDADYRNQMISWCFEIIDFCKFDREIVGIAASYLDRFMKNPVAANAKLDVEDFQLTTVTCLYTAMKIHAPAALSLEQVTNLSRGLYSESQIKAKEMEVLAAIGWRMNPPTAMAFVRELLDLIPEQHELEEQTTDLVYNLAKLQTERAIADSTFIPVRPSVIAYCSILNALNAHCPDTKIVQQTDQSISQAANVDGNDSFIIQLQNRLYHTASQKDQPVKMTRVRTSRRKNRKQATGIATRKVSVVASPHSIRVSP